MQIITKVHATVNTGAATALQQSYQLAALDLPGTLLPAPQNPCAERSKLLEQRYVADRHGAARLAALGKKWRRSSAEVLCLLRASPHQVLHGAAYCRLYSKGKLCASLTANYTPSALQLSKARGLTGHYRLSQIKRLCTVCTV